MVRINEWNCTKGLVAKAANTETQLIEINIIRDFLKQVQMLKSIHHTQNKYGFIDQRHCCNEIFNQILCEFSKIRPAEIENSLKDYSVGLTDADNKMSEIKKDLEEVKDLVSYIKEKAQSNINDKNLQQNVEHQKQL